MASVKGHKNSPQKKKNIRQRGKIARRLPTSLYWNHFMFLSWWVQGWVTELGWICPYRKLGCVLFRGTCYQHMRPPLWRITERYTGVSLYWIWSNDLYGQITLENQTGPYATPGTWIFMVNVFSVRIYLKDLKWKIILSWCRISLHDLW